MQSMELQQVVHTNWQLDSTGYIQAFDSKQGLDNQELDKVFGMV